MNNSRQQIIISLAEQTLRLLDGNEEMMRFTVSTAANGAGEQSGSECTPRGRHVIRAKIGRDCAVNTVFVGRRPTGEIYSRQLATQFTDRDWILTRILWLCGTEPGVNRFGQVDTMRRYIYIHGSPDETVMGVPGSHGCIRMHNNDVIRLYDNVRVGTSVIISDTI